ncbi:MAG: isochorismatase family protein [Candidatus Gracilibacteria bacterium]|nr:isochorismatase family protein [Candidatus Gracilibacteria bacterium]
MKTATLLVDCQKGFGDKKVNELYVPGGEQIVDTINSYMTQVKNVGGIVIASRELHQVGNIGFASSYVGKLPITSVVVGDPRGIVTLAEAKAVGPAILSPQAGFTFEELIVSLESQNGVIPLWPDHCVDMTPGAEYMNGLDVSHIDFEVVKGNRFHEHPFSAALAIHQQTRLTTLEILEQQQIEQVDILGLATDYCDKDSAIDIVATGKYRVRLILAGVRAVNSSTGEAAIELMRERGIQII